MVWNFISWIVWFILLHLLSKLKHQAVGEIDRGALTQNVAYLIALFIYLIGGLL